jgi:hypothetical protein
MAKKQDKDLFDVLRASGLRKKVARGVSDSASRAKSAKNSSLIDRTVESLRDAASELESRVGHSSRSDAAKKAARTRKRSAAKRSASARKAAKTRAKVS